MSKDNTTDWGSVYSHHPESGGWTYLSALIVKTMHVELNSFTGKHCVEAGCGSGKNALEFSKQGADMVLLDLNDKVLEQAEARFDKVNQKALFVQGDIFNLPFKSYMFDVVCNFGVIEHWVGTTQIKAISEMIRVCKQDGTVITMNPNKNSRLYEIGKRVLRLVNLDPFIDEVSVKTLTEQSAKAGGRLAKNEYSVGFFILAPGLFLRFSTSKSMFGKFSYEIFRLLNIIYSRIHFSFMQNMFYNLDKFCCKILGGYLLVSVIKPNTVNRDGNFQIGDSR